MLFRYCQVHVILIFRDKMCVKAFSVLVSETDDIQTLSCKPRVSLLPFT